ncbi:MAG TPA: tetratricopeptide repeat protein [Bacteroidales bacterium]|nr:tetratricopeptide repeat protein [Bacteroidales bacterium]
MASPSVNKKKLSAQHLKPLKNNSQKASFTIPPWAIYAVLVITALIYIRALSNGFCSFDDDDYVFKNPDIRNFSFEGLKQILTSYYVGHYHPLTMLTYFFEYKLFGLNPMPYHLFNVILHLANTFLVYKLAEKLSGNRFTAIFAAALFALHPMHVESVAWVSERKDVLYALFYFAALIIYINYVNHGLKLNHYLVCLLLFVLSLLSKSVALTLPVLMIAIDLYKNRKPNARMFLEKIPFLALSIVFGLLAIKSQQVAMKEVEISFSFLDRIFLFTYAISFYIVKLLAPLHLSVMHYYPGTAAGALPWMYYASLPFLVLLGWLLIKPSRFRREKLFGAMFFLIVISVMLQIISVGDAITSERYSYISYFGLSYIAGQWVSKIRKEKMLRLAKMICLLLLILFAYLSWDRIKVWKNGIVLFTDVIKKYPDSYHAYWVRGNIKCKSNNYESALDDYNKSLQNNPNFLLCLNQRSLILIDQFKNYPAALQDLNLSIKLDSNTAETYNNRGQIYEKMNDTAAALRDFNKAIMIDPGQQKVYNNRGALKLRMGNYQGALTDINKAIELNPEDGHAYTNRAGVKYMLNDYSGTIEDCKRALALDPGDYIALYYQGMSLYNLNDKNNACSVWTKASEMGYAAATELLNQYCK